MASFATKNSHTFQIEPDERGKAKRTLKILKKQIEPASDRRRGDPEKYLIIGYDTEFQSIEPVDREELRQGAKNKLLSYQFATQLIEGNVCGDIGTPRSSGIIIPKTGKRIFLEEFIAIAMADFLENNPDSLLPRDIYLVGHFNRMDLPGFEEFKNTAQKMAANVRGTFASITGRQKLEIRNGRKNLIEAFNIRLRDTLLLAPESK